MCITRSSEIHIPFAESYELSTQQFPPRELARQVRCAALGLQRGPIVHILEPQGFGEQALLHRALDGACDIFPHGTQPDGIRVFPQNGGLFLRIFTREVQVG